MFPFEEYPCEREVIRLKKFIQTVVFLVLGMVLPFLTMEIKEVGDTFLPMHLPVMLCGFICGPLCGGVVGLILPFLRSICFSMPPLYPNAVWIALELAVYGLVTGLLYFRSQKKSVGYTYFCLIAAMASGRIVWGIAKAVLLGLEGRSFTLYGFLSGALLDAIPGILLQLILIPVIIRLINRRERIMKYIIDNDLHIHSIISSCSNDEEQTPERILKYAEENGLKTICLTDHFWDESVKGASKWYEPQNYAHISAAKPLPQSEKVRFLFGCETELDKNLTLGISKERFDSFDFVIIPTTHLHMKGFTLEKEDETCDGKARAWVRRFEAVLNMDLPFHKIGIAHLTCGLIASTTEEYIKILKMLPEDEMRRLFNKAADVGVGIEINLGGLDYTEEEINVILRPYRIAKECGCKFYLGSDAHRTAILDCAKERFERAIDLLSLTEEDKFII